MRLSRLEIVRHPAAWRSRHQGSNTSMTRGALLELLLLAKKRNSYRFVTLIFVTILFLLFFKFSLATGSKFPRDVSSRGLSGSRGKCRRAIGLMAIPNARDSFQANF